MATSSIDANRLIGVSVLMHDTNSTWVQYVVSTDDLPNAQPNTTNFALLQDDKGARKAGLYYWPSNGWQYALTAKQISQIYTADFLVELYYKWTQPVSTPALSQVYQNTGAKPIGAG